MTWKETGEVREVTRKEAVKIQVCDQCDKDITSQRKDIRLEIDTHPGFGDAADYIDHYDFCSFGCLRDYAAERVK